MIAVHIDDVYLEAIDRASLPPEIKTRQSKVNYLVRLGLRSLGWTDKQANVPPSAVAGERNRSAADPQDHSNQSDVTEAVAQNVPRGTSAKLNADK